jgi:hypothetical protein
MKYDQCIKKLKILLDLTDPADQAQAIHNFAAAVSLVNWVSMESEKAHGEFNVFLSYFEKFALLNDDEAGAMTQEQCFGELTKLSMHLPEEGK